MERGWLDARLGCSSKGKDCTERERRGDFSRFGKAAGERECFGEWKGGRILSGFNACRACIGRCAGLKDANLSN